MTIQTHTNNPAGADAPIAGLPDIAMLNKLAGEFFAALPSGARGVLASAPAGAPAALPSSPLPSPSSLPSGSPSGSPFGLSLPFSPPSAAPTAGPAAHSGAPTPPAGGFGAASPTLTPHASTPQAATQNGLPDAAATGRAGGIALGVPQAYAAALPMQDAPSQSAPQAALPASPYYFVGEASSYPALASSGADLPVTQDGLADAQSFGLPGSAALLDLLRADRPAATGPAAPPAWQAQPSSAYYFIDPTHGNPGAAQPDNATQARPPFDVHAIRRDFPILQERVNGRQLVWFDNAATTHKPQSVIDRLAWFYAHENSNIHRAAHELAARATDAYEGARNKVARFLGAGAAEEIIFVRGATEAINLIAKTWGAKNIGEGDEIIVSHLEHHANIVPWQQLAAEKGAKLRVIPVDDSGQVLLDEYQRLLNGRTKLVSVTQVSNALGTVVPVKQIVDMAHRAGARTVVDGAQSVSHMRVDVRALDTDFFVFSGHKVFGPTGIGVVYGKRDVLEDMPPWQGGGNMIADVTFERTQFQPAPSRFEAGTGNIADAVGLGAALDYVERIGMENIARYEHDLLVYATRALQAVPGVRIVGTAADKASVLSFVLQGYETAEVGKALNEEGIAVRSGHHCAQPILRRMGLETTVRPSLAFYNTCEEVDRLVAVVSRLAGQRRLAR